MQDFHNFYSMGFFCSVVLRKPLISIELYPDKASICTPITTYSRIRESSTTFKKIGNAKFDKLKKWGAFTRRTNSLSVYT